MRRALTLALAALLALAACGGDSGEAATDTGGVQADPTQAVATQPASEDGGSDETKPPTGDSGVDATDSSDFDGSGPSTATVTLGDQTYNFSTEGAVVAQCLTDLFGTFSIQLPMINDNGGPSDGSVAILVLHEGTDPEEVSQVNAVEVSVGDEDWVADEADMMLEQSELLEPGMSQVDSVEMNGRAARGTATFFRQNSLFTDQVKTATGTFEATCGEERTS